MSRDHQLCGFVPMQGVGANRERLVLLHGDEVGLRVDGRQPVDADRLRDALFQPRVQRWSEVEVGGFELYEGVRIGDDCVIEDRVRIVQAAVGSSADSRTSA
ncbi:MAG: hypothetical protein ACRDT0_06145 [Pseudonocardiaceae bacterium]